ncbi:MAG: hypothetical protein VCB07_11170, partial [Gammaproteobacteria bacterium]
MSTNESSVVAAAQRFATDVIAPNAEHWENVGRVPYDAIELMESGSGVTVAAAHAKKYATRVAFLGCGEDGS